MTRGTTLGMVEGVSKNDALTYAPSAAPVLFPVRGGTDATVTDIKKYEDAAKNAQEIKEKYYTRAFAFIVSYEMAKDFRKRDGGYVRPTQWQDLIVDVYVRKVTV